MSDYPLLLADVGATNARFAALTSEGRAVVVLRTRDFHDAGSLVERAARDLSLDQISRCCFAIAGPVMDGVGAITNGRLRFEETSLAAQLQAPVLIVNDFQALAMAVPHLSELVQVGGVAGQRGPRVVLGPGSGLGVAFLLPRGDAWEVLPSEGGHADLAPGNLLEIEVLSLLHQQHDGVCWESVLSGPGLVNLYHAVCAVWGTRGEDLAAEEISGRGMTAEDPVCHQTLELFLGWLGSAAGNLALTVCARGGVYIGGGIVPALGDFVLESPLRRRFEERAGLAAYVRDIPLHLIREANPGLLGAQVCLEQMQPAG
jgi:glucokinase